MSPQALAAALEAVYTAQGKAITVRYAGGGWIAQRARLAPGPEIKRRVSEVRTILERHA